MARPLRIEYAGAIYHVTSRVKQMESGLAVPHGRTKRLLMESVFEENGVLL